ncbi:MAG: hypothetical protein K2L54_00190, partial [Clostridiales bacterium]|nr:hypothetical protein [Clostridiales bacterium]
QYYVQGNSANKAQITNDEISIPHYVTDANNRTYTVLFDQYGKYNESTGEYAKMSVIKSSDGVESNAVSVTSDNPSVIAISGSSHEGFMFRARGKGVANIKIKANVNNTDAPQDVEKTLKINVQSSTELGYIENIYLFDKAVVNADFIEKYLDSTRNRLDIAKLTEDAKNDPDLNLDPKEITLPYNTTYDDIFSHVLISPITIQYDSTAKAVKNDWYKSLSVKSSNEQIVKVNTDRNGAVSVVALGLASTAQSATACKLTFSDTTAGNIKVDNDVSVRVVAQNESGKLSVKVGTTDYAEGTVAPVAPNVTATLSAIYNIRMSGKTDVSEVVDKKYLTGTYMLDFDPSIMEVRVAGSASGAALEPNKVYELTSDAMTIVRTGSDTASITNFEGTVKFTVKIKEGVKDDTYTLKFTKVGTSITGNNDWNGKDKSDRTWDKTASFEVTAKATKAFFIDTDDATALVTRNNLFAGRFVPNSGENPTGATIYIQNQPSGTIWNKANLFDVAELVGTDVSRFKTEISVPQYQQKVFGLTGSVLTFRGQAPDVETSNSAEIVISVFDIENAKIGELTLYVKVIDAITAFEEIKEQSVEYDKVGNSQGIPFGDLVKVKRTLNITGEPYSNYTVKLYFGSISADTLLVPEEDTANKITYYSHNGKRLFKVQSFVITPVTDLYAYGYSNNISISDLRVEFTVNAKDFYHVEGDPSALVTGVMACKFMRIADGVAAFKSGDYSEQSRITSNRHSANQGSQVALFISSSVDIINASNVKETVYTMRHNNGAFAVKSYIQLPTTISATGDPAGKGDNTFYTVRFEAPHISSGSATGEDSYELTLYCGSTPSPLTLIVQNLARSIVDVGIYEDMQCSNEISGSTLEFGKFIGKSSVYNITVYVKISYEPIPVGGASAQGTTWQYYEAAVLTLPEYLTASGSGIADKSNGEYHLAPTDPDIYKDYGANGGAVIACKIALKPTASEHESDYLTIHRANKIDTQLVKQNVKVGTGLSSVTVSDDNGHGCVINAGGTGTVEYTFELKNIGATQPSYRLNLNFGALTSPEYPDIAYNNKSLTEFALSYNSIAGLTVSDFSRSDNPYIQI